MSLENSPLINDPVLGPIIEKILDLNIEPQSLPYVVPADLSVIKKQIALEIVCLEKKLIQSINSHIEQAYVQLGGRIPNRMLPIGRAEIEDIQTKAMIGGNAIQEIADGLAEICIDNGSSVPSFCEICEYPLPDCNGNIGMAILMRVLARFSQAGWASAYLFNDNIIPINFDNYTGLNYRYDADGNIVELPDNADPNPSCDLCKTIDQGGATSAVVRVIGALAPGGMYFTYANDNSYEQPTERIDGDDLLIYATNQSTSGNLFFFGGTTFKGINGKNDVTIYAHFCDAPYPVPGTTSFLWLYRPNNAYNPGIPGSPQWIIDYVSDSNGVTFNVEYPSMTSSDSRISVVPVQAKTSLSGNGSVRVECYDCCGEEFEDATNTERDPNGYTNLRLDYLNQYVSESKVLTNQCLFETIENVDLETIPPDFKACLQIYFSAYFLRNPSHFFPPNFCISVFPGP